MWQILKGFGMSEHPGIETIVQGVETGTSLRNRKVDDVSPGKTANGRKLHPKWLVPSEYSMNGCRSRFDWNR